MIMRRLFCVLLALCMALCLAACGDANDNHENADQPQNTPDTNEQTPADDPVKESEEDEPEVSGTVYTITVTDEGGNPVSGAMLQMCQGEICLLPAATDANGVVTFTVSEDGDYEAKFLALPAGYEYVDDVQVFPFNGATGLSIVLKAVA